MEEDLAAEVIYLGPYDFFLIPPKPVFPFRFSHSITFNRTNGSFCKSIMPKPHQEV